MRSSLLVPRRSRRLCVFLLWLLSHSGFAQLQLTYPLDRMVVQRDNNNTASVQIAGSYSVQLDLIEARFVSLQGGQTTDWATLQANPTNGQFNGNLTAQGGWYRIEVRGKLAGQVVGTSSLAHFGVGEVFAIFGHSNAQGSTCNGTNECDQPGGALDERVNSIPLVEEGTFNDYYLTTADPRYLPDITYGQWTANSGAAPFHSIAWCWARMGDRLVEKLNVPVLFYGAGFGGTMIQFAYQSMNNEYFPHGFCRWELQMPYANVRNLMNLYVPTTGIRGILLIHGENDRNNSQETIRTHYREVMKQFRQKFSKPQLAWVVALSSYVGQRNDNVRNAQWQAVADINSDGSQAKVFLGPDLDPPAGTTGPTPYRPDGIHYSTQGQLYYAQLWADNLTADNNAFFRNSTPYLAEQQPLTTLSCADGTRLRLRQPDGYNAYTWKNGSADQQILAENGVLAGRIQRSDMSNPTTRDAMRIYFPPATAVADGQKIPNVPTITATSLVNCGAPVTLTSSATGRSVWSTGVTAPSINVSGTGSYSVQAKHPAYECASASSNSVSIAAGAADLNVRLVANQRIVTVGNDVRLTMTVENNGPCAVSGVQLQNRLPDNLTLMAAETGLTNTGTFLSATLPTLAQNETLSRSFTVRAAAPGTFIDAFQITASSLPDPDSQPNSGTGDGQDDAAQLDFRTIQPGAAIYASPNPNQTPLPAVQGNQPPTDPNKADLSLSAGTNQRTASAGQPISFSLTVQNTGGLTATNVQLRSTLPAGLTFLSSSSGLTHANGIVSGTLPALTAGAAQTVVFTATATSTGSLRVNSEVSAADQPDPDSTPGNGFKGEDDEAQVEVRAL